MLYEWDMVDGLWVPARRRLRSFEVERERDTVTALLLAVAPRSTGAAVPAAPSEPERGVGAAVDVVGSAVPASGDTDESCAD